MIKHFRKEDGITVAELIATIAIASIIVIFITSIFIIVQNQYSSQKEDASHLTDVKLALKAITRDIRKAESVHVENDKQITIEFYDKEPITYKHQEGALYKDESIYIYDVLDFFVEKVDRKVTIEISSGKQDEKITIILRE